MWLTGQGAEKRGGKRGRAVRSVVVTASQKPRSGGEKPHSRLEESEGHKAGTSLSVSPLGIGAPGAVAAHAGSQAEKGLPRLPCLAVPLVPAALGQGPGVLPSFCLVS